jgi:hypothetical protein
MSYERESLEHMSGKCVKGRSLEEMEQCPYATLDCQVMCYAEQVHNVNIYEHPEDFKDDEGDNERL